MRIIFGDAAAATLISKIDSDQDYISPTIYGTDGKGATNLCVLDGGMRNKGKRLDPYLRMHGPKIFEFTLNMVPRVIN